MQANDVEVSHNAEGNGIVYWAFTRQNNAAFKMSPRRQTRIIKMLRTANHNVQIATKWLEWP